MKEAESRKKLYAEAKAKNIDYEKMLEREKWRQSNIIEQKSTQATIKDLEKQRSVLKDAEAVDEKKYEDLVNGKAQIIRDKLTREQIKKLQ